MFDAEDLITIGKIEKPFGVKGDVRVRSLSDVPGRFEGLRQATLVAPSGRRLAAAVVRVREDRSSHGRYVVGFDAFSTPEEAATFRGGLIQIPRSQTPPLPAGQYYEFQLIGLTVKNESGRRLGTLNEVLETGGNHTFVIRDGGRELLIPAAREVVRSVDAEGRTMTVRLPEGLLDGHDAL